MIQAVLLDVDGTLVLSNDAHAESWVEACSMHGVEISFDQVRWLIGMGGDKLLPALRADLNKDEGLGKAISEARTKLFLDKYAGKLRPALGARQLVEKIQSVGLETIVASSAKDTELKVLLRAAEVEDLLTKATTSSEVERSKPEPDIVKVALEKLDIAADQVLMLGDTPYDIEAAEKVGVGLIAVRCGGFSDDKLTGAVAIYDNPADLLEHWDESPLV